MAQHRVLLVRSLGQFKSVTTKQINAIRNTPGALVWQRNYYEHIIRTEKSRHNIQQYIKGNSQGWAEEVENLENHC